jgi:hypothetical protein
MKYFNSRLLGKALVVSMTDSPEDQMEYNEDLEEGFVIFIQKLEQLIPEVSAFMPAGRGINSSERHSQDLQGQIRRLSSSMSNLEKNSLSKAGRDRMSSTSSVKGGTVDSRSIKASTKASISKVEFFTSES